MENTSPLVAIKCMTYNHESYISQCLDGFIMQKTDFPFIAVVHDDASIDGTAEIVREYAEKYPEIIKPIYETENQYSKHDGSLRRIVNQAIPSSVKYIAMCEGDDYWTDPLKLQKQVDVLESDPKVGIVYTNFNLVDCDGGLISPIPASVVYQKKRSKSGYILPEIIRNNIPQTLTVIYRQCLSKDFEQCYRFKYDWPLFIHLCGQAKAVFIEDVTGCYRINPKGAMASNALSYDYGGFETLSDAFIAFLNGKYNAVSMVGRVKILLYIYYRVAVKRNINNGEVINKLFKKKFIRMFLYDK